MIHAHPGLVNREEHGDVIACVTLTNRWWETTVEVLYAEAAVPGNRDLPHADLMFLLGFLASIFADEMESVPPASLPPTRDQLLDITTRWRGREPSRLGYVTASNVCRSQMRLGHLQDVPSTLDLMDQQAKGIPDYQTRATAFGHVLAGGLLARASPDERRRHASQGLAIAPGLDTLSRAQVVLSAGETMVVMGDLTAGWAAVREAYRLVPSPEASYFWVPISHSVAYVGFLVGAWEAVLEVASYADAAPLGRSNYSRLVLHGWLVNALRGVPSAGTGLGAPLETHNADDPSGAMGLVGAAVSQRHSDPAAARRLMAEAMSDPAQESVFGSLEFGTAGYVWSLAAELAWRDPGTPRDYMTAVELGSSALTQPRPPGQVPPGRAEELWKIQAAAHLARATGNHTAASWRALAAHWDRVGAPHQAAEARLRLAEDLVAEDRAGAAEALSSALSVAQALEARPLADEIRGLAARARLKLAGHEHPTGTTGPLTAREHEVLELLVQGMTNQQIGDTLFMSPKTASVHVSHILDKLSARNRTEVASIAHRRGLIEHD